MQNELNKLAFGQVLGALGYSNHRRPPTMPTVLPWAPDITSHVPGQIACPSSNCVSILKHSIMLCQCPHPIPTPFSNHAESDRIPTHGKGARGSSLAFGGVRGKPVSLPDAGTWVDMVHFQHGSMRWINFIPCEIGMRRSSRHSVVPLSRRWVPLFPGASHAMHSEGS
jgi:hypothetical protein